MSEPRPGRLAACSLATAACRPRRGDAHTGASRRVGPAQGLPPGAGFPGNSVIRQIRVLIDQTHLPDHSLARSLGGGKATRAAGRRTAAGRVRGPRRGSDPGRPAGRESAAAGIPTTVIGKRWKFDPFAYRQARAASRRLRPDLVHTWLFAGNAYGRTAALLRGWKHLVAGERSIDPWKSVAIRVDRRLAPRTPAHRG